MRRDDTTAMDTSSNECAYASYLPGHRYISVLNPSKSVALVLGHVVSFVKSGACMVIVVRSVGHDLPLPRV